MTDRPWLPEHPVGAALAASLVARQFPAVAAASPVPVHEGQGFDNDVWRFGPVAFRFPRRAIAVRLIASEIAALPWLAGQLPVPIPAPAFVGRPSPEFPHPVYGHPDLPGTTADRLGLGAAGRGAIAPDLGRFLRALHAIDPAEAAARGVRPDDFRGDTTGRSAKVLPQLARFESTPWAERVGAMAARLGAPPAPETRDVVVLHGDVYARHLLVGPDGRLAGVIDWGDVCLGDRAVDLAAAYTFLPASARDAFWAAYGPVDAATRERARFLALARHGFYLPLYALDVGDAPLLAEAGVVLGHVLED
ncbi:MAG: phosphotransferase [Candidatus Sericytochromatia bacterium]